MTDELPVLKPLEPIMRCGTCGEPIYEHSAACSLPNCALRGEQWQQYKRARAMQNAYTTRPVDIK